MLIVEPQNDECLRELRVGVALKYHIQLRQLKILRGKTMAAAVEEALDDYFSNLTLEDQPNSGRVSLGAPIASTGAEV